MRTPCVTLCGIEVRAQIVQQQHMKLVKQHRWLVAFLPPPCLYRTWQQQHRITASRHRKGSMLICCQCRHSSKQPQHRHPEQQQSPYKQREIAQQQPSDRGCQSTSGSRPTRPSSSHQLDTGQHLQQRQQDVQLHRKQLQHLLEPCSQQHQHHWPNPCPQRQHSCTTSNKPLQQLHR